MEATVPSFAKLNLDLRILNKRSDGYHELRTIFQTISMEDRLYIRYEKARRSEVTLDSSIDIPDNLVLRAAHLVLEQLQKTGRIHMRLQKRIPMGAGLGGGSSNAAAVLIALPALMGVPLHAAKLVEWSEALGSDIAFFLYGGTALGIGRGTELYPLPSLAKLPVVVLQSGIHVSTGKAYQDLNRPLTLDGSAPILGEFQTAAWSLEQVSLQQIALHNDFERAVFQQHPKLASLARALRRAGGQPVRMTGSGSALFGLFPSKQAALTACQSFKPGMAQISSLLDRKQYRKHWMKALGEAGPFSCFGLKEAS